jgi:hypothetical protein
VLPAACWKKQNHTLEVHLLSTEGTTTNAVVLEQQLAYVSATDQQITILATEQEPVTHPVE